MFIPTYFTFHSYLIIQCRRRITKVGYFRPRSIDYPTPLLHERKLSKKVIYIVIEILFSLPINTIPNLDKLFLEL
jgi:hypothetical protein